MAPALLHILLLLLLPIWCCGWFWLISLSKCFPWTLRAFGCLGPLAGHCPLPCLLGFITSAHGGCTVQNPNAVCFRKTVNPVYICGQKGANRKYSDLLLFFHLPATALLGYCHSSFRNRRFPFCFFVYRSFLLPSVLNQQPLSKKFWLFYPPVCTVLFQLSAETPIPHLPFSASCHNLLSYFTRFNSNRSKKPIHSPFAPRTPIIYIR